MCVLAILLLLMVPSIALANIGLPMLAVVWPLSVPAIIPVIALESWMVHRALNVDRRIAFTQMAKANILSTVVGIPLAWVASVVIEFFLVFLVTSPVNSHSYPPDFVGKVGGVVLTAPWLGPFENGGHWIVPVATTVLLIPFFFASYWVETWYVALALSPNAPEQARRAIWNANLVSYMVIFCACIVWLVYGLATHA
jgi:hypothetical protein